MFNGFGKHDGGCGCSRGGFNFGFGDDCCSLIMLLLLINNCGCDFIWIILLLSLCGCGETHKEYNHDCCRG